MRGKTLPEAAALAPAMAAKFSVVALLNEMT
jgi:hypothetical protein